MKQTQEHLHFVSSPPLGSRVRLHETSGGLTLEWPTPRDPVTGSVFNLLAALGVGGAFLLLFAPSGSFVTMFVNGGVRAIAFVFWLAYVAGWALFGVYVCFQIVNFVRGRGPERLFLTEDYLYYRPASALSLKQLLPTKQSETQVPWHQLASLKLNEAGALVLERGVDSIEIGEHLSNAEREWLLDVIVKSAKRRGYRR